MASASIKTSMGVTAAAAAVGSAINMNAVENLVATTTTKALLVSISVPRVHRCYIPPQPSTQVPPSIPDIGIDSEDGINRNGKDKIDIPGEGGGFNEEGPKEEDNDGIPQGAFKLKSRPDPISEGDREHDDVGNNDDNAGTHDRSRTGPEGVPLGRIVDESGANPPQNKVYDDKSSSVNPLKKQMRARLNSNDYSTRSRKSDALSKQLSALSVSSRNSSNDSINSDNGPIQGVHNGLAVVELRPVSVASRTNSPKSLARKTASITNSKSSQLKEANGEEKGGDILPSVVTVVTDPSLPPPPPPPPSMDRDDGRMVANVEPDWHADDLNSASSFQKVNPENTREPSGEIIGYVAGEESPKQQIRHKRINSNPFGNMSDAQLATGPIVVKDIVTAEELAAIVKIAPDDNSPEEREKTKNENGTSQTREDEELPKKHAAQPSILDGVMKMVFGSTTVESPKPADGEAEDDLADPNNHPHKLFLTQSAAVDAIKHRTSLPPIKATTANELLLGSDNQPLPNTEIKVEVLVQLALKNLQLEGHLLNSPICNTAKRAVQSEDGSSVLYEEEWVTFTMMVKDPSVGIIIERLERIGVGSSVGTVSIYRAEYCRTSTLLKTNTPPDDVTPNTVPSSADPNAATADEIRKKTIAAARKEWMNAASRLRVEQVAEQIHESAQLSFDYISLLVIASVLAGIGLITNSTVVIVASMLVSPIMGPVMGFTFGFRVLNHELTFFSLRNELYSLLVSIIVGVLIGLGASWSSGAATWPTNEMSQRGEAMGLVTGIAVAIPSGCGVALSILGNNTSSLVGVAISASLLPPAVNAGICWMHAFLIAVGAVDKSPTSDFWVIGAISLALTIVNILCIWISGILMFWLKEVAPTKSKSAFWSNDIKVARAIKKGNKKIDLDVIKIGLEDALAKEDQILKSQQPPSDGSTSGDPQADIRKKKTLKRVKKKIQGTYTNFNFGMNCAPAFTAGTSGLGNDDLVIDPTVENAIHDIVDPDPPPMFETSPRMASVEDLVEILGLDGESARKMSSVREVGGEEIPEEDGITDINEAKTGWFSWRLHY